MDHLLSQVLPQCTERADIVRPGRLQGFSDAVIATAATLLIVPLRRFELEGDETLKDGLIRRLPQLATFLIAFLVICALWQSTVLRFEVITHVDDVIVVATLFFLMFLTFLPFGIALLEYYDQSSVVVLINCGVLFMLSLGEWGMFIYAFFSPKLLNETIQQLPPNEIKFKLRQIHIKYGVNIILIVIAASVSNASSTVSLVALGFIAIMPLCRRVVLRCSSISKCCHDILSNSTVEVVTRQIDKERIECFSDAVIAIVATLLVLDLTTEEFPTEKQVKEHGLPAVLESMWPKFVAYVGAFDIIAVLWFVHHSVLNHIKVFSAYMVFFNNIFLAFVAVTPFVSTLLNKYSYSASRNEQISVQFFCIVLFMAGLMHICILVLALWNKHYSLHEWAIPDRTLRRNTKSHLYLMGKCLVLPLLTLMAFLVSTYSSYTTFVVYHVTLVLVPVAFIVMKVLFACHFGQRGEAPASTLPQTPRTFEATTSTNYYSVPSSLNTSSSGSVHGLSKMADLNVIASNHYDTPASSSSEDESDR